MSFRQPTFGALARARAALEASRVTDSAHPSIHMLAETWQQVAGVCADLSESQFMLETDCPGWNVKDQVAHIIGTERTLLGDPLPREPIVANYVRNDLGAFNEAWVENFRGWMGGELMIEFRRVTQDRLEQFERMGEDDMAVEIVSPVGILAMGDFLNIRVIDCLAHEQDIRRAVGRPGHLDGDVARFAVKESLRGMPKVVARGAHATDGTAVTFDVEGEAGMRRTVVVEGNRGRLLDGMYPDTATCTIDLDVETFLLLCWGRISGGNAVESALVGIDGDVDLGRAVLASMNLMP